MLVESTAAVTLESVEDYAAVNGDCIVQVPEVRLGPCTTRLRVLYSLVAAACAPTLHRHELLL